MFEFENSVRYPNRIVIFKMPTEYWMMWEIDSILTTKKTYRGYSTLEYRWISNERLLFLNLHESFTM